MMLSELIEELKKTLEDHGDLEVRATVPYSPSSHVPVIEVHGQTVEIFGDDE